jgi:hypothetical protein
MGLSIAEFMFRSFRDLRFSQFNAFFTALAAYVVVSIPVRKLKVPGIHPADTPQYQQR